MHYLDMALIDKASLLMVPSTYEAGTLYNVLPSGNRAPDSTDQNSGYDQTRADFTFDRGSNAAATRVNADGLIEKYRENLLLQSNQFDTSWVNSNTTETSGQEGYDGTNNAWLLSKSAASGYMYVNNSVSGVQTFSIYAKSGSLSWMRIVILGAVDFADVFFNLADGSVGLTSGLISSNSENIGGGWYRYSITINGSPSQVRIYPADFNGNVSGTSGNIYIQDAQREYGLVATDYLDSGATTAKAGVLIDLPRINYDANGENGSLLLEPSRQQLFQYSEYFDSWTKVDTTLTHNYGTSPEGVKNSTRVQFSDSTAYMYIAPGGTSSGTYASSIYIKGTDGETIKFGKGGNVASGAMHTLNGDWQRIEHITTDVGLSVHISTYGGSTARDIEIYGCQLEAGSYKSSYIPNMGESGGVTRAADSCSVTGVSDVIGQTEGTLFLEFDFHAYAGAVDRGLFSIGEAGQGYVDAIYVSSYNNDLYLAVYVGGSVQSNISKSNISIGRHKIAIAYKANDFAYYLDGVQIGTDSSGSLPTPLNFIGIGNINGGFLGDFDTTEFTLFNERLSNAELAALTA